MICDTFGKTPGHMSSELRTTNARKLVQNIGFGLGKQLIPSLGNGERLSFE